MNAKKYSAAVIQSTFLVFNQQKEKLAMVFFFLYFGKSDVTVIYNVVKKTFLLRGSFNLGNRK